jgi:hypothetical protein
MQVHTPPGLKRIKRFERSDLIRAPMACIVDNDIDTAHFLDNLL